MSDSHAEPTDAAEGPGGGLSEAALVDAAAGDVVALAQELVRIDTTNPPARELPAAEHMAAWLAAAGLETRIQRFGADRANLVARLRGTGERPALMLSGHLDTVPVHDPAGWTVDPHGGLVRGDRLFGRGSLDMKGAVAAMSVAAKRLRARGVMLKGDVVVALTAGEETDSCGAELLCDAGWLDDVGMAVIGEPTDMDVGIGHRGALWVRVDVQGTSAHGSQPGVGLNAVQELLDWLEPKSSIEQLVAEPVDDTLGAGSVSLNIIGGGTSANVIPDRAHAVLDFRTVPGQEHAAILSALHARGGAGQVTVLRDGPPIKAPVGSSLVQASIAAVAEVTRAEPAVRGLPYMTDASTFGPRLGIPTVVLGPGAERFAHIEDESIDIAALETASAVYEAIAERLLVHD